MLTLTAPGNSEHYLPDGTACPCTPAGGVDLPAWNSGHSARWNHFRTVLKRDHEGLQFFRGVEVQDGKRSAGAGRGALHDHAMVWSPTPLSTASVRKLAIRAGFGHVMDLAPCEPGSRRAAYYVSKYVTKATDSRDVCPWLGEVVDLKTGEVTEGLVPGRYRTWSMSREWGDTMAAVKAQARVYARHRATQLEQLALIDAMTALKPVLPPAEVEAGSASP